MSERDVNVAGANRKLSSQEISDLASKHSALVERRLIVIDLDGTLCDQTYNDTYKTAAPRQDVIDRLNAEYDAGAHVTIFTARGMGTCKGDVKEVERRYRTMTEEWLLKHQVMYHRLVFGKPPGDIYVDDRGMTPEEFVERA